MNKKYIGDLFLAAAYLSYGAELDSIDKTNPDRQKFVFTKPPKEIYCMEGITPVRIVDPTFELIEMKYVSNSLMFPPGFISAIRRAKDAIYSR